MKFVVRKKRECVRERRAFVGRSECDAVGCGGSERNGAWPALQPRWDRLEGGREKAAAAGMIGLGTG